jgi:hypothetical protein
MYRQKAWRGAKKDRNKNLKNNFFSQKLVGNNSKTFSDKKKKFLQKSW